MSSGDETRSIKGSLNPQGSAKEDVTFKRLESKTMLGLKTCENYREFWKKNKKFNKNLIILLIESDQTIRRLEALYDILFHNLDQQQLDFPADIGRNPGRDGSA